MRYKKSFNDLIDLHFYFTSDKSKDSWWQRWFMGRGIWLACKVCLQRKVDSCRRYLINPIDYFKIQLSLSSSSFSFSMDRHIHIVCALSFVSQECMSIDFDFFYLILFVVVVEYALFKDCQRCRISAQDHLHCNRLEAIAATTEATFLFRSETLLTRSTKNNNMYRSL